MEKSLDPWGKKKHDLVYYRNRTTRRKWRENVAQEVAERGESMEVAVRESVERQKLRGTPAPCGRRQSEFRELALTGRYCRVHLASVQFGSWIWAHRFPIFYAVWGDGAAAHSPPESG